MPIKSRMLGQDKYQKYQKAFVESRIEFQKRVVSWTRLGILIPSILFFSVVIPFGSPITLFLMIAAPLALAAHWSLTWLLLRRKFQWLCPYFLNLEICFFAILGIETLPKESGSLFSSLMTGIDVGLLFSILLVSKLPMRQIILSSTLVSGYLIWKASSFANFDWVTIVFYLSMFFFLLSLYWKSDAFDYRLFCELQRKEKSLAVFKQVIQSFPTPLLIVNEKSYSNQTALFMNEEAKKIAQNLDLNEFLSGYVLDELNFNKPKQNSTAQSSLELILKQIFEDKGKSGSFSRFITTSVNVNKNQDKARKERKYEEASIELDCDSVLNNFKTFKIDEGKFEIIIGNIEWNSEEDGDAIIIIFNYLSEREKIIELKLMHENKDRLLATFSHGLRTPINGIIGMLDIVNEKISDKKLAKHVSIAKNSAKSLLLMISDILDTSQMQKGMLALAFENVNLGKVIDGVLPLMRVQIKKKGLTLKYLNMCDPHTKVWADKNRLEQILFNLISNACKFTEKGEIIVEVFPKGSVSSTENKSESRNFNTESEQPILKSEEDQILEPEEDHIEEPEEVIIKVSDTGRGIKPEVVPQLFKIFGKFEVSGNETGVGLGLAISQGLAKQMSEHGIQVRSEYGKGSEFWLSLRKPDTDFMESDSLELKGVNHVNLSKRKTLIIENSDFMSKIPEIKQILIVDDDQINHLVLAKMIASLDFPLHIDKEFNGQQAVIRVRSKAKEGKFYDLILMDCNMPVMDGFQATKEIRALIDKGVIPEVKIVAVTANTSASDQEMCLNSGMNDIIPKPIHKGEFEVKLRNYLKIN